MRAFLDVSRPRRIEPLGCLLLANLVDGLIAFLPRDLDFAQIAKGKFITHRTDLVPTRKSIRDADGIMLVSGDQLALEFDARRVSPDESGSNTAAEISDPDRRHPA